MGTAEARSGSDNIPTLHRQSLGTESITEKAHRAVTTMPFWVIAVSGHLILAAVLAMTALRHGLAPAENVSIQASISDPAEEKARLEDTPEPEIPIERSAIPIVETIEDVVPDTSFWTATDDVVNLAAEDTAAFGVVEGTTDEPLDLMSMSTGGRGLAGAIGLGGGSGPGGGARRGSPLGGSRLARRNAQKAGLQVTEKAVMAGLDWLARHQSPDGSWDCDGFPANCKPTRGGPCLGRGSAAFDVGVTGLALLPFLGAGYDSSRESAYRETVTKGLKNLRDVQDAEGCFGPRSDSRFTYSHAIATLAMCEAYASAKRPVWRRVAQHAIDFINACQNPYKAWRYGLRPGDNDVSVTGWMLMALKAGKDAGLAVNERTMRDGLAFIESMTDEDTGRTGYIRKGELPVRPEGLQNRWPASASESLTAVGMCARVFCGTAEKSPMTKAGAELLSKALPIWDEARGTIDMYYWYYGTLALYQLGGEPWDRWNRSLKDVVIAHQVKDGCAEGSWDPLDPWGDEGGRIYSTSLSTLCMEVYYRYPRVFGTRAARHE